MVFLLLIFSGLGIWQLDRAAQKRQLTTALETVHKLPAASLNHELSVDHEWKYRNISAEGRFLADKTVLIENRKHLGENGYHVITPLQLADSARVVLVNRGWIPAKRLLDAAPLATPSGTIRLRGEIRMPQPPALALDFTDPDNEEIPLWPYLTIEHFARWSGLQILPITILQSPADTSGFIRAWPQPRFSDAMHIGYAVQWFAFALITLLIWLQLSLQKGTPQEALQ
jgi:surfeit locus 1 family protein